VISIALRSGARSRLILNDGTIGFTSACSRFLQPGRIAAAPTSATMAPIFQERPRFIELSSPGL
jgi:hypothetical protein